MLFFHSVLGQKFENFYINRDIIKVVRVDNLTYNIHIINFPGIYNRNYTSKTILILSSLLKLYVDNNNTARF